MQYTLDSLTEWPEAQDGLSAEERLARQLEMFVEVLQGESGGPRGYRLRRILLTNFWLYGSQEFEIPHGRLFLAGENASGKSTVLTAALPLALDGDIRPHRLDTFGGRERHIEYYILGGSESATPYSHERRTSYIALEFEWCNEDTPPFAPELRRLWENGERDKARFLTIGVSLAGNVNASERIRPLRFLITDGSRLGHEMHTVYEVGSKREKHAFDHPRFKQQMEGHGIICETQAEYERQVARYLFGFNDVKEFQKLIDLLLVLRRPNLSSELSFSRVHDYLKQSLRKISGETTSHVIGTIERIDAIQIEKERSQEAYGAADRLHQAQQRLAMSRAQLAACEYSGAQMSEDNAQHRVTKLRKDLQAAEQERERSQALVQTLQVEQHEVSKQIATLESSEGLQVAKQLASLHERAREAHEQAQLQEQSLAAARRSKQTSAESLQRQLARFETIKTESVTHIRELGRVATEEGQWEVATFQLQQAQSLLASISLESPYSASIHQSIAALAGILSEERIAWLQRLETLHQEREKLDAQVQNAREYETTRFQELDETRRRFQAARDRFYDALATLNSTLEQFAQPEVARPIYSSLLQQDDMAEDEAQPARVIEQCARSLDYYRQTIESIESALHQETQQVQARLNDLQVERGGVQREFDDIITLYEQKRDDPEFAPPRQERHALARAKLAEHGITALPFYTLLDFIPEIDCESAEAGRIEHMLEDAGLLDALVVPPAQAGLADELLASEGLSDRRVDIEGIKAIFDGAGSNSMRHITASFYGLRFDETVNALPEASNIDWEPIANALLMAPTSSSTTDREVQSGAMFAQDGTWTHGILSGYAGSGTARCIGKTTRWRVQQRELEAIQQRQAQLAETLAALAQQIELHEAQLASIEDQTAQVRRSLAASGIEPVFAELAQIRITLESNQNTYQKARLQTQAAWQRFNSLVARLERECNGNAAFASERQRVQSALQSVIQLQSQARSLQTQLDSLHHAWEECHSAREAQQQAATNEANVASLYERLHAQAIQARAEENELQHIAETTDARELSERLLTLRQRIETVNAQLNDTRVAYSLANQRAETTIEQLAEVEERLQGARQLAGEKRTQFADLLAAYPVEELIAAQRQASEGRYLDAARRLLGETLREADIPARREKLNEAYREAFNIVMRIFNREQPLLLEYGPDLDEQGQAIFLNENKSRAIELLELLSERIRMQQMLLNQEETKLFEDFLLHEIAEAIRSAIFEGEEWVQQINKVLSGLPMIGEHYALQWKTPAEYDLSKPGSHLAHHYRLLRKPTQALTAEETETLMNAFRQEIDAVRLRQQERADMNFLDALEQVFDYREWFHFDVLVSQPGGQRQRLTDRVAGTRSGAEQLFALYVPLFAALGALDRSAAPGAPRLLALDEAFDKVSVANMQRIMEFLVSQDFQWIMTGPQISGTGAKIPACARYLMIHEKGSPIATASASFWSDSKSL
jgi:Putative exonuclease SbcCD, C subunit